MPSLETDQLLAFATAALQKLGFKAKPDWSAIEWADAAKAHLNKKARRNVVLANASVPREVAKQILLFLRPATTRRVLPGKKRRR